MTTPTTQREADERDDEYEAPKVCISPLATRPVLYTDTVGGNQTCRDDLWAVTTDELNALHRQAAPEAPVPVVTAEEIRMLHAVAGHMRRNESPRCSDDLTRLALKLSAAPEAPTAATDQPSDGQVDERAKPDDIRAAGWTVAVHNDYRLNGEAHTFWLFTKDGHAIKGEGRTDAEALDQVRASLTPTAPQAASQQDGTDDKYAEYVKQCAEQGKTPMKFAAFSNFGFKASDFAPQAATTASASDPVCEPVWRNGEGNFGETVVRCATCGTFKGRPCRLAPLDRAAPARAPLDNDELRGVK